RLPGLDDDVARAVAARDAGALDRLALAYDQQAPDAAAPGVLRELARERGPVVGYLGKLIPQKGVDVLIGALAEVHEVSGLIVGFGQFREWLTALTLTLGAGDEAALRWLAECWPSRPEAAMAVHPGSDLRRRIRFTGRLDHRYAPAVVAAMDVLVVPSVLEEAFGMVAAEGAAAGALPLVARHSGLAEVAVALERHVGREGMFSFEPGPRAAERLADGIRRLVELPPYERQGLRAKVSAFATRAWSWERTADRLLEIATKNEDGLDRGSARPTPPHG
ncbi:MAG: glycosyltransferase, partial [Actinomycetota bacterium]